MYFGTFVFYKTTFCLRYPSGRDIALWHVENIHGTDVESLEDYYAGVVTRIKIRIFVGFHAPTSPQPRQWATSFANILAVALSSAQKKLHQRAHLPSKLCGTEMGSEDAVGG
ncbi:hypothetical protein KM043_016418 [Ampulex compressa]|nr:hypothetical protein KM043_016418 [Ampulex compressa]